MKVLWITGWYPNVHAPYEGDFIQRQALSASLFDCIHVLYVNHSHGNTNSLSKVKVNSQLVETTYYAYLPNNFFAKFNIYKQLLCFFHYKKRLDDYLQQFGRPDIIHIHIPLKLSLVGLWIKNRYKIPIVVSEHWGIYDRSVPDNIYFQSFVKKYLLRKFLRSVDDVISVSHYLGEGIKKFAGINSYRVINNVVDTSVFNYKYHPHDTMKTILHISNMDDIKNPNGILQVIRNVTNMRRDLRFIIIGVKTDKFEKLAADLGVDHTRICFIKEIPYLEVADYLHKSDALLMFSFAETFSCVTAEALCCGVPVAAVNRSAFPELINEKNGVLANKFSVNAMTDTLLVLLDNNKWDHKEIAADAISKYAYSRVGKDISLLYGQILANYHTVNS